MSKLTIVSLENVKFHCSVIDQFRVDFEVEHEEGDSNPKLNINSKRDVHLVSINQEISTTGKGSKGRPELGNQSIDIN